MEFCVLKPDIFDKRCDQSDQFYFRQGTFRPHKLNAKLMVLSEPSALRFFIAESRGDIKHLYWLGLILHSVLQISTDSPCGPFRL